MSKETRPLKTRDGEFIRIDWEDDSEVEYVYGHVHLDIAKAAFTGHGGIGCDDSVIGIKHRWARKVPSGKHSEYEWMLHTYDAPARGAFAVTELELTRKP